jgi:ketosteroid isomerase-like protein
MSEENMEIVRRIYGEGLIDRDPKRLLDQFVSEEIEYVDLPGAVDPGVRRGRKEVLLALRRARQSFASYEHEPQELFDQGETVIAAVRFRGTARRASKNELIEEEQAYTWTFRDGKVVRLERAHNLEAALGAAGQRE